MAHRPSTAFIFGQVERLYALLRFPLPTLSLKCQISHQITGVYCLNFVIIVFQWHDRFVMRVSNLGMNS